MSQFEKHRQQNTHGNQDVVGKKVENMEVLAQGGGDGSLKLGCLNCHIQFWYDDEEGGRHTVMRPDIVTGEVVPWAQCPKCGCEWDGRDRLYWIIGIPKIVPDNDINQMAARCFNSPLFFVEVAGVGMAATPQQAIADFSNHDDFSASIAEKESLEKGFIATRITKQVYDHLILQDHLISFRNLLRSVVETISEEEEKGSHQRGNTIPEDPEVEDIVKVLKGQKNPDHQ